MVNHADMISTNTTFNSGGTPPSTQAPIYTLTRAPLSRPVATLPFIDLQDPALHFFSLRAQIF